MDLLKNLLMKDFSEQVDKYPDVTNQTKRSTLDKIKLAISEISTTSSDTGSTMKTWRDRDDDSICERVRPAFRCLQKEF